MPKNTKMHLTTTGLVRRNPNQELASKTSKPGNLGLLSVKYVTQSDSDFEFTVFTAPLKQLLVMSDFNKVFWVI
jgi:hypothetical protein